MSKIKDIKRKGLPYNFIIICFIILSLLLFGGCGSFDRKSKDMSTTDINVDKEIETELDHILNTEIVEDSSEIESNTENVSENFQEEGIDEKKVAGSGIDNKIVEDAYLEIINAYIEACAENSDDWLMNQNEYLSKYIFVNKYIMEMYHTPSHYDEDFESDEPYELYYMTYDIDSNGISELLLSVAHHEMVIFAVYTFDGEKAVELGLVRPENHGSYEIYTNNVITAYNKNDVSYYKIGVNGFSVEKIELSFDEICNQLEYQLITSLEDWRCLGKDVATVSNESENDVKWNMELIENIKAQIIKHYTELWQPDGEYTIFSNEDIDNSDEMIFILRYARSDKNAEEIIANGGAPSANTLVTAIHINKSTGEVYDEDQYGDSWTIDFTSKAIE